ncbi:MAG TPA: hypothetical protein VIX82_19200 [Solirubrobacteraceae bacterium]
MSSANGIREQYEAGEGTRGIAAMFELDVHDVLAALPLGQS